VECALAPEFTGGVLLSMKTLRNLQAVIDLSVNPSAVHLKRLSISLRECETRDQYELFLGLKSKSSPSVDPAVVNFVHDSWGSEVQVLNLADIDDFLRKFRERQAERLAVVVPAQVKKLFWAVLRDLIIAPPKLLAPEKVHPAAGPWILALIGPAREARHFRTRLGLADPKADLVTSMLQFTSNSQEARELGSLILAQLIELGALDGVRAIKFDSVESFDHEEDNRVYTPALLPPADVEARLNELQIGASLPKERVLNLFRTYKTVLLDPVPGAVPRRVAEHRIILKEDRFVSSPPFRLGHGQIPALRAHIQELLDRGMIAHSKSPFASNIFPVPKKPGPDWRWVLDFRKINQLTVPDRYPIPNIETLWARVCGSQVFSKLDLRSGYWQVAMAPRDSPKTAFQTPFGLFEWKVLPFGLCNAPSTFQRMMNTVLADCKEFSIPYFDDILIFSKTAALHMDHLKKALACLSKYGLRVNSKKCILGVDQILFLGFIVSGTCLRIDPKKIEAVQRYPVPKTVKEVQRFLGLAGYVRQFIRGFSAIAAPLIDLTRKGTRFVWRAEHQHAFQNLCGRLTHAPVLAIPDFSRRFFLETDASIHGVGGVLCQESARGRLPVAFASRRVTRAEAKYSTRELKVLAVLFCCRRFASSLGSSRWSLIPPRKLGWAHGAIRRPE